MPAGYILVDSQVTDPEQFKNYGALAPAAVAAAGGQYLLDMNATATSAQRCPPILTTTRLIRTDRNGREVEGFQIFRGPGIRACGE